MRVIMTSLTAVLLGASGASAQTVAGCQLSIDPSPSRFEIQSYDPFEGGQPLGEFDVVFSNNGGSVCEGKITASLEGEPYGLLHENGGTQRLAYALVDETAGADITPRYGETARSLQSLGRDFIVGPGENIIRRFSLLVEPNAIRSDGSYDQTVTLSVMDESGLALGARQIDLALDVDSAAVLGVKGAFERTDSGARIDLGELSSGATNLPVTLYVLSTGGYRISVQSENGGVLKLSESGQWMVPYSLALGGRAINLSRGGYLDIPGGDFRSDDHPLTIEVGDASEKRAGHYADTLTFTVSPL